MFKIAASDLHRARSVSCSQIVHGLVTRLNTGAWIFLSTKEFENKIISNLCFIDNFSIEYP